MNINKESYYNKMNEKQKLLAVDFVIKEEYCNMSCQYCLTGTSTFKKTHILQNNPKVKALHYEGELKYRLDRITDILLNELDIAVLKISGGEILMIPNIMDYVMKYKDKFKAIQILTNGLSMNSDFIRTMKKVKNLSIQLSLDHHTKSGNQYRSKNEAVLKKILNNMDQVIKNDIPLEINCVLTDVNTHMIKGFVEYLLQYESKQVILLPFSVRGPKKRDFFPHQNQLGNIEELINQYEIYRHVLAPKEYLIELYYFLLNHRRKIPCKVPLKATGVFDDGIITPCPNYWIKSLGCLLDENNEFKFDQIGKSNIYNILSGPKNRIAECSECFTPWEILNLYYEKRISLNQLKLIPSYGFDSIERYLSNDPMERV